MVHECLTECGTDPSGIHNIMSVFIAKFCISPLDSQRQIQVHQTYVFARANQSTNHLIDRGANGGSDGADMRVLQKNNRKINIVGINDHELTGIVGIDDHELTGLNVDLLLFWIHKRVLSLESSMNMPTLVMAGLSMLLDNGII